MSTLRQRWRQKSIWDCNQFWSNSFDVWNLSATSIPVGCGPLTRPFVRSHVPGWGEGGRASMGHAYLGCMHGWRCAWPARGEGPPRTTPPPVWLPSGRYDWNADLFFLLSFFVVFYFLSNVLNQLLKIYHFYLEIRRHWKRFVWNRSDFRCGFRLRLRTCFLARWWRSVWFRWNHSCSNTNGQGTYNT